METIKPRIKRPDSIHAFIRVLGGRAFIASTIIGRSSSSVSNWLADGIPARHHRTLVEHGKRQDPPLRWLTYDFLNRLNDTLAERANPQDEDQSIAA